MQSNSYASPQLLCPRPTLPPSSSLISPHFSWYDWPSEAPANVYQPERSRYPTSSSTSLFQHRDVPQAVETQHSFGNQHVSYPFKLSGHRRVMILWFISQLTSKVYPAQQGFAESVPMPLASSYLGDGHTSAPIPSFDQCPSRSTHFNIQPYSVVSQSPHKTL